MARPTLADRLRHILDGIADIETFTAGKSVDDYLADSMRRHAVERCLEIISEARTRHFTIPWRGVADFGNVLRHDYLNVKDQRVWQIVTNDLAALKGAVETMLADLQRNGSA
jgi:uncharacterized protein with HEPN domain